MTRVSGSISKDPVVTNSDARLPRALALGLLGIFPLAETLRVKASCKLERWFMLDSTAS